MNSCLQTVVVEFPFSSTRYHSMEMRPALPQNIQHIARDHVIRMRGTSADTYWYPCGQVHVRQWDGTRKAWHPKPTLMTAVQTKEPYRVAFQFHTGNIVTAWYCDEPFYWSAPMGVEPINGQYEKLSKEGFWELHQPTCIYDTDEAEYESHYYYNRGVDNA
jgi:hypothetical protein